jgi:NAD(P)-dependent dehydrogenase (short-subunit alcohol dehydrogenase family)
MRLWTIGCRIQVDLTGTMTHTAIHQQPPVLVLGGTGKVGRRVAARLASRGVPVRIGARSAAPSFDWNKPAAWGEVIDGAQTVFISYAPDLAVPGAPQAVAEFTEQAAAHGATRLRRLRPRNRRHRHLEPSMTSSVLRRHAGNARGTAARTG